MIEIAAPNAFVIAIFLFALLEEIGWRGFALRRLLDQHTPFTATLIVGIPWALLHFALWEVSFAPVGGEDQFLMLAALIVPIPTLVALVMAALNGGIRSFWRDVFKRHSTLRWLLIGLGIAFTARLLTSILALFAGAITALAVGEVVVPLLIVTYLFALLEEIGWRGFAVRKLVTRQSPLVVLLITGIPWSIIHIFFYLNQGADATTMAQVFVANFMLTVMVTWIYLRSGQNIWPAVILHGSQTLFSFLTSNIPTDLFGQYWVISYSLVALALLVLDWRMWFARPAERKINEAVPSAA